MYGFGRRGGEGKLPTHPSEFYLEYACVWVMHVYHVYMKHA